MCSPTVAEKATLAAIAGDPAAWMGRCVTVKGIYSNERVYADIDAVYGVSQASVGGYVDAGESAFGFWRGEFTGRVSDCAKAAADIESGLLRSPGILIDNSRQAGCLAPRGPFLLFMSQGDLSPVKLVRRKPGGSTPGRRGGDLTPAPADWPHLAAVEKLAGEFLAALQAKDAKALGALMRPYDADQLLKGEATAISDLAKPAERQRAIFTYTLPGADPAKTFASEVCYCRTKDCATSWPIARRDADNQLSRPYACVRIDGAVRLDGSWRYVVDATADRYGAQER